MNREVPGRALGHGHEIQSAVAIAEVVHRNFCGVEHRKEQVRQRSAGWIPDVAPCLDSSRTASCEQNGQVVMQVLVAVA